MLYSYIVFTLLSLCKILFFLSFQITYHKRFDVLYIPEANIGQKSLIPVRRAQWINKGRTPFICTVLYVLLESPFASVSKVNRGHPSLVSLLHSLQYTPYFADIFKIYVVNSSNINNEIQLRNKNKDASGKNSFFYILHSLSLPRHVHVWKT